MHQFLLCWLTLLSACEVTCHWKEMGRVLDLLMTNTMRCAWLNRGMLPNDTRSTDSWDSCKQTKTMSVSSCQYSVTEAVVCANCHFVKCMIDDINYKALLMFYEKRHAHTHTPHTHTHVHIYKPTHRHVHTYKTHTHTHLHIHTQIHIHIHICAYTHTCTHTCIYTHVHIHTH